MLVAYSIVIFHSDPQLFDGTIIFTKAVDWRMLWRRHSKIVERLLPRRCETQSTNDKVYSYVKMGLEKLP